MQTKTSPITTSINLSKTGITGSYSSFILNILCYLLRSLFWVYFHTNSLSILRFIESLQFYFFTVETPFHAHQTLKEFEFVIQIFFGPVNFLIITSCSKSRGTTAHIFPTLDKKNPGSTLNKKPRLCGTGSFCQMSILWMSKQNL